MKYVNTSSSRRVWPNLQNPDGTTVELDPGEEVEIKGRVVDPVLKRTKPTKKEQDEEAKKEQEKKDAEAAASSDDVAADSEETK